MGSYEGRKKDTVITRLDRVIQSLKKFNTKATKIYEVNTKRNENLGVSKIISSCRAIAEGSYLLVSEIPLFASLNRNDGIFFKILTRRNGEFITPHHYTA